QGGRIDVRSHDGERCEGSWDPVQSEVLNNNSTRRRPMNTISRREAMGTIITAGAGVTLAGMTQAAAQTTVAPAFRGQHQPKPLPFDAAKLKGISEKLIKSHWENNYG